MLQLQAESTPCEIRKATSGDYSEIIALVEDVVQEIYGHLFTLPYSSIKSEDWSPALIATAANQILGVTMTQLEWVSDLWVRKSLRGRGIGISLLKAAEHEITTRGYPEPRLRVVHKNASAIRFYERAGWKRVRSYPHESLPVEMLGMKKVIRLAEDISHATGLRRG